MIIILNEIGILILIILHSVQVRYFYHLLVIGGNIIYHFVIRDTGGSNSTIY